MKRLFITCSQGLEYLLCQELTELVFPDIREGFRGVYVDVPDEESIYRINYCSRLAGRVLLPLKHFKCFDQRSLYREASSIEWRAYIRPGKTFAIDANVNHRQLRNSLFAAQVVKDAICDQFRQHDQPRPNVDVKNPDVQLNLFIHQNEAVISFDTSGMPLYKRGYRQESVEAPMQESLAAAMLRLANYRGEERVFDPCCGSGTLLIEAALIATQTAPGYLRKDWGFMQLPDFSMKGWLKVKAEADQQRRPLENQMIAGCDLNKNAVRIAKINLRAAGFASNIEVAQADFREYEPSNTPNLIIANPPHGIRLNDEEQLRPLYRALGDFMKRKTTKPARGFVFTSSMPLTKEIGLASKRRYVLSNSGIESRLLEFDLYA